MICAFASSILIYRAYAFCFSWLSWMRVRVDPGIKRKVWAHGGWNTVTHLSAGLSNPLAGRSKTKFSNGFPNYASDILNWV